jgi:hypothetical protein
MFAFPLSSPWSSVGLPRNFENIEPRMLKRIFQIDSFLRIVLQELMDQFDAFVG